jgi:hypothetical protein
VSQSSTARSSYSTFLKSALPAAAFAIGLAAAAEGHATQYFLQSASMNTSRTANIDGPGYHAYTYVAPITFTAFEGTGATPMTGALSGSFNLVAFCVDVFHHIGLGTVNLKYDDNYELTTNSKYETSTPFAGGTALSAGQRLQVGRLVNYGTLIYDSGAPTTDKVNRLAGLQGAIWQVINPGYTVVSSTAGVNAYTAAFSAANYLDSLTGYGPVRSNIGFITETGKYGTNAAHQSFAFASVPEPSTWIVMIAGFGMMGASLRRARPKLVPVRA